MATKFLEPGGDADFQATAELNGFWIGFIGASPSLATDFVHGTHVKSLKFAPNAAQALFTANGVCSDAGTRISFFLYVNALPTTTKAQFANVRTLAAGNSVVRLYLTTAGVLQLWEGAGASQIGADGPVISAGSWYRICLSYTATSTTVNRFEVFVNGGSAISVTNATITRVGSSTLVMGNGTAEATFDFRTSDHYVDNSSALTDTGEIWVTAKRPVSNGTTNDFTTQIGSGGSGYGSGHAPQVNERPVSLTNGWSVAVSGVAKTEEYSIEGKAVGDIDISTASIIDFMGWISANPSVNETAQIIVGGVSTNVSLLSAAKAIYTKYAGSTTYPAGNTDIGITTSTDTATVKLYDCGVVVAFIPAGVTSTSTSSTTSTTTSTTTTSSSTSTTTTSSSTSSSTTISTSSSTTTTSSSTSTTTTSTSTSSTTSSSTTTTTTTTSSSTSTTTTSSSTSTTTTLTTSTSTTTTSSSTSTTTTTTTTTTSTSTSSTTSTTTSTTTTTTSSSTSTTTTSTSTTSTTSTSSSTTVSGTTSSTSTTTTTTSSSTSTSTTTSTTTTTTTTSSSTSTTTTSSSTSTTTTTTTTTTSSSTSTSTTVSSTTSTSSTTTPFSGFVVAKRNLQSKTPRSTRNRLGAVK